MPAPKEDWGLQRVFKDSLIILFAYKQFLMILNNVFLTFTFFIDRSEHIWCNINETSSF